MSNANPHQPGPATRRIVVVGSGIAGTEAALTLAIGLPHDSVTLVGDAAEVSILPDLVYVPFGVSVDHTVVAVDDLLPHGVRSVRARVGRVDVDRRVIETSAGDIEYDVLVVAPGASPVASSDRSFRSVGDALRVRSQLLELVRSVEGGGRGSITICAGSDGSWSAPACELALLFGTWLRAHGLGDRVDTLVATADRDAFEWFGPVGESYVERALRRAKVQVATGVPAGRFDALGGDLVVEFGALRANALAGLPGLDADGWYRTGPDFSVARNVFVVGDAVALPYRAAFATAWQARRVLRVLGGDVARLGVEVDGISVDAVEYQMDLGDGVLRARIVGADVLARPFLGHDADVELVHGGQPSKLAGLLLADRILRWRDPADSAPAAFRDRLLQPLAG